MFIYCFMSRSPSSSSVMVYSFAAGVTHLGTIFILGGWGAAMTMGELSLSSNFFILRWMSVISVLCISFISLSTSIICCCASISLQMFWMIGCCSRLLLG
jgi:hypothetical protein